MIQEKDLAYLAGIIDGEGFVGVKLHRRSQAQKDLHGDKTNYQPGVTVCNTNQKIIDAVADIMTRANIPHHIAPHHADPKRENRKQVSQVDCSGFKRCIRCLWLVEPYLVGKRPQAQMTLAFIWLRLQHYRNRHIPYSEFEMELVEALYDLNKRGPHILNEHTSSVAEKATKICAELRGKPEEVAEMTTRLSEFKNVRVYK